GQVRLQVRVHAERPEAAELPGDGPWVGIAVEDTGVGIPGDRLEEIFEPFIQVDRNPYTRTHEGTGLGLGISRRLARMMGGDVTVESEPGAGSTFTLWLTRATPEDTGPPERRRGEDRRSGEVRRTGDRRADD
ncbi:MAG: ATP-binding protein, partial [Gemmatimonadota bacterium]